MQVMELANGRASLHEAFKHLLVGSNALLYVSEEVRLSLDRYVLYVTLWATSLRLWLKRSTRGPSGIYRHGGGYEDDEYRRRTGAADAGSTPASSSTTVSATGTRSAKARRSLAPTASHLRKTAPGFHSASIASTPKSTVAATPSSTTATCWRWSRCIRQS